MKSWEMLKQQRERLSALKKIAAEADPASGISFQVRRGVLRDNPDYEDDDIRRPLVNVEFFDLDTAQAALLTLCSGVEQSIAFWERCVKTDIEEAEAALEGEV